MRYLRLASYSLTAIGLLTVLLAASLDRGPATMLSGMLLTLAGIVKIVVVQIWVQAAGLGTDHHRPIPPP